MTVSLKDNGQFLGEIPVHIKRETVIDLNQETFVKLLKPVLKPAAVDRFAAIAASDGSITFAALANAGITLTFDASVMDLTVHPPLDQRVGGSISMALPASDPAPESFAKPAQVSAYVNLRGGVQYVSAGSGRGLSNAVVSAESAIRVLDLVIENEASVSASGITRQGSRVIYDDVPSAIRTTAGDVTITPVGFAPSETLLGITVQKAYGLTQPQKNIRPTGRRSFRLERPSTVDVIQNGQVIRKLELNPGDYELKDLGLRPGENLVKLDITDDTGARATLDFTILFDRGLLAGDVDEWSFGAGIRSTPSLFGQLYAADTPVLNGAYTRGVTEVFTAGGFGHVDPRIGMGGLTGLWQTSSGLFLTDAAFSVNEASAKGYALRASFTPDLLMAKAGLQGGFQLSGEMRSGAFGAVAGAEKKLAATSVNALYAVPLDDDYNLSVTSAFTFDGMALSRGGGSVALTKFIHPGVSWSLTASYDSAAAGVVTYSSDFTVLGRLTFGLGPKSTLSFTQDGAHGATTAALSTEASDANGRYGLRVTGEKDPRFVTRSDPQNALSATVDYSGSRFEANASHARRFTRLGNGTIAEVSTVSAGTSIAYADGDVAIGKPISDSFAIVKPHESLAGANVAVGSGDKSRAQTDALGAALVTDLASYTAAELPLQIEGAPDGYDVGDGVFHVRPGLKSGFVLAVGSAAAVTAVGIVERKPGDRVTLVSGVAKRIGGAIAKDIAVFTNEEGRFSAQGLDAGDYQMEFLTTPETCFRFHIPEGVTGYFDAGTVSELCRR